jgi:hypothetical protein
MIFSDYLSRRKIKSLLKKSVSREHCFCSLNYAKTILVLYNVEDEQIVIPFIAKLQSVGKKVNTCVYIDDEKTTIENEPSVIYIVGKNLPKSDVCNQVKAIPSDILIDLSDAKCNPLKYLMLQHPSTFKVGIRDADESMHDFALIMTGKELLKDICEQMYFYLQTIRAK